MAKTGTSTGRGTARASGQDGATKRGDEDVSLSLGPDSSPASPQGLSAVHGLRGSNQSGMRAYNERLVLSLIRRHGALAKSEIARMTGLSAQTISVIMRSLEGEQLLAKMAPVRGRVGQPLVPMQLNPHGAYFFGLKIGRRSADLVLVDFLGTVRARLHRQYPYPTVAGILRFAKEAIKALTAQMPATTQARIAGLGVAMPFQLWDWAPMIGVAQRAMDPWRDADMGKALETEVNFPVFVQNDASAACGAEVIFGAHQGLNEFLHFYIGYFIGGGLVMNGSLYTGRTGNAGALGSLPVPLAMRGKADGQGQLLDVASLFVLERALGAEGADTSLLWESTEGWPLEDQAVENWVVGAGRGLAYAIASATAIVDFEAVLIDGWLPPQLKDRLVAATKTVLDEINMAGLHIPAVLAGTIGPDARALGAAGLPLSARFLVDRTELGKNTASPRHKG